MARPGAEELVCAVSLDVHASVTWVFLGESGREWSMLSDCVEPVQSVSLSLLCLQEQSLLWEQLGLHQRRARVQLRDISTREGGEQLELV